MTCTWMLTWESVSWKHDLGKLFCLWNSPTWVLELFFSCHTLSDVILCLFYLSSFFFHSSCISHSRFFSSTHASLLHRDKATLAELCIRLDCVAEWGLGFKNIRDILEWLMTSTNRYFGNIVEARCGLYLNDFV